MADNLEPLLAEAEGYGGGECDFSIFDEDLLAELRSMEAGAAGQPEHVEDEDVYKMRELIREKPKDVIQYLEEEGVAKLGEFEVQDAVAFKAFGHENMLTTGADHYEVDWESMWREQLSEYSRSAAGIGWTTKITMEAHVVNLRDAAAEGSKGLLHPLLKRYHARGCSAAVFGLPAVQAVINYKWHTWAKKFLLYELACYLAWLAGYTAFTLLFQQEDWTMTFWQLMADRNGFAATVFSLLTLLPMAPFLYMELCTIAAYGFGWVGMWNIMDLVSYVLQIVICVLHVQREFMDEGFFSVMLATQHVLMWTKLHYFAKAFNPTKTTLVDTVSKILEDLKWFLVFLTLTMLGFALAFYSLYRQDREQFVDFANVWHSMASMYSFMLAMFDYNVFYNSTNPTAAMLLFIAFEFVMNVLLLNVLIASMTNSFSKITQDEGLRFLCSKAEIIDELETTLPDWLRSPAWHPPFVHILKFHPDSTYEVSLSNVWSGIGLMENNLLGAQQETRCRVEELEDRVTKLHKKLDVLIKLFISSMSPSSALGMGIGLGAAPGLSREMSAAQAAFTPRAGGMPGGSSVLPPWAAAAPAAAAAGGAGGGLGGVAGAAAGAAASPFAALHTVNEATAAEAAAAAAQQQQHAAGAGAAAAAAAGGPGLRHALSQLPEALAAVSGPLLGPGLHMGYPHPLQAYPHPFGAYPYAALPYGQHAHPYAAYAGGFPHPAAGLAAGPMRYQRSVPAGQFQRQSTRAKSPDAAGARDGTSAGVMPAPGLQQQQQQQHFYPPYAMMGGGWYPYPAYGMPGIGPAAVGVGLGLRRNGSGSSRHRAAAGVDAEGRRVRHGVLQRSHSL
ncbi:hypothetical protein OEZ86_012064 [Tetradesmus obliquus]|nr:hypothetical protein OEZ86_012064 [Tetradesmus obliquus]